MSKLVKCPYCNGKMKDDGRYMCFKCAKDRLMLPFDKPERGI